MTLRWACAFLSMTLFACFIVDGGGGGGGSGLPGSARLPSLDPSERNDLCEYLARAFPRRTVTCENGTLTIGFSSAGDCVTDLPTNPACTATVDQTEACFEDFGDLTDEEICDLQALPASCSVLVSAACQDEQPDPAVN